MGKHRKYDNKFDNFYDNYDRHLKHYLKPHKFRKHWLKSLKDEEQLAVWIGLGILAVGLVFALLPFLLAGGLGFGLYKLYQSQKGSTKPKADLDQLKNQISRADYQLKQLEAYQETADLDAYAQLAKQTLPLLGAIQSQADQAKSQIKPDIYRRICQKVATETQAVQDQLAQIQTAHHEAGLTETERTIQHLAPELLDCYRRIIQDDLVIRDKLKTADNRAERTALHDANMNRFEDILEGYLKIKAAPLAFHKAEERLAAGLAAMEAFDETLDETLRQLNEGDLADFDISLRLMRQEGANDAF